jgi:hypothetical protein
MNALYVLVFFLVQVKELEKVTGAQVMLLIASEQNRVYCYSSDKLDPMIDSNAGM